MPVRPPRLRLVLLAMMFSAMAMPLAGLFLLRVYESALVRQTETELVAQAAVLSAAYRVQRAALGPAAEGDEPPAQHAPGPLDIARRAPLDLAADVVLPPAPEAAPGGPAAPLAARVGAALDPVLRAAQEVTLAGLRITDARGVVVATTGADLGRSLANLTEVQRAAGGEFVSLLREREHKARLVPGGLGRGSLLRVHVAMPVIEDGRVLAVVVVSRTPNDILTAIWGKRFPLAGLAIGVLVIAIALALAASRLITRPIGAVAAQARRVAAGDTAAGAMAAVAWPGTREVAELSAAISGMAATLDRRATYVRDLAAHIAHEFKTPIAAATGAAELAGEPDVSPADRARLLGAVDDALRRLERLTSRLLDLARADMLPSHAEATPLFAVMAEVAANAGLPVTIEPTDAAAAVSRDALAMMLGGLIDNARRHAGHSASVHLSAADAGKNVRVTVTDDGSGVPAADAARIFDPFFTTARASGGTGMGLPIIRALATGAGGAVSLVPSTRGAAFELVLPAA